MSPTGSRALHGVSVLLLSSSSLFVTLATAISVQRNYSGYQVFRIEVSRQDKWLEFYAKLLETSNSDTSMTADVWRLPAADGNVDVLVDGNDVTRAKRLLDDSDLKYQVTVDDVTSLMSGELASNDDRRRRRSASAKSVIGCYAKYDKITAWMNSISKRHSFVSKVIDIGMTSEGRRMKVLKIGLPGRKKWKVWLDGGIHAREWIAPATVLYLADQLLQGYINKNNDTNYLLQKLDFYFLPVANPDGYEYSHTKDRLWRKNRKLDPVTGCYGIDLNRNWRFQWGTAYSSDDPCNAVYRGSSPEDSIEVENIVNFLSRRAEAFIAFLTYHSYGQRFITRWDYSKDILPNDHHQLMRLAQRAVKAMYKVHGTVYEAGRAPELMYPYGGGSPDWARAIANIKYSYLIELRDKHSFILPIEEILPTGEENWAALRVIGHEILLYYGDIPAPDVKDLRQRSRDSEISPRQRSHRTGNATVVLQKSSSSVVKKGDQLTTLSVIVVCLLRRYIYL